MNKEKETKQQQEKNRRAQIRRLRNAVDKIRNVRHSTPPPEKKQTWFSRLKERLGLTEKE
jgi:hypothetical protein